MQQIAQRLHFGGQALHFEFGGLQGRAGLRFGGFRPRRAADARLGGALARALFGFGAGFFGVAVGSGDIGRAAGAPAMARIQPGARSSANCPALSLRPGRRRSLRARSWAGLVGAPARPARR